MFIDFKITILHHLPSLLLVSLLLTLVDRTGLDPFDMTESVSASLVRSSWFEMACLVGTKLVGGWILLIFSCCMTISVPGVEWSSFANSWICCRAEWPPCPMLADRSFELLPAGIFSSSWTPIWLRGWIWSIDWSGCYSLFRFSNSFLSRLYSWFSAWLNMGSGYSMTNYRWGRAGAAYWLTLRCGWF